MGQSDFQILNQLLLGQRWAVLATLDRSGSPQTSHVAYAMEEGFQSLLLHLSELAPHTANFQADDRVSIAISEPDSGAHQTDPQRLVRVALEGLVRRIDRVDPLYDAMRMHYLATLPCAEPLFEFKDFSLYRLEIRSGRLVGGFGRARKISRETLKRASSALKQKP